MRSKRLHLWWVVPLVAIAGIAGAQWWFLDALRFGNATPLHRAVLKNDSQRVKHLIARGADVDARMKARGHPDMWDATPLHLAAVRDLAETVEDLIGAGADKDATDEFGFTPLHIALKNGADSAAQVLIRAHAKLRSEPGDGRSGYAVGSCGQPLGTALGFASIDTVRLMLEAGADLRSDVGGDAMAYVDGPDRLPKLHLLLERQFSVEGSSPGGRALHVAAYNNDAAAITLLLDHGAALETRGGDYEFTPLLAAAYSGSNDAVKVLLERGANPKAGTDHFGSPIYAAAFSGKRETVRLLLSMDLGIDLQAGRASDMATPLHMAYWNDDMEMADLLVKAGANPDARTTHGRPPSRFRK